MSANLENRVDWASRIESWQSCGLAERRKDLLGPASRRGIAYRWGIAIASGVNCSDAIEVLSRLAVGSKVPKALRDFDLERSLRHWFDVGHRSDVHSPIDAAVTLNWAAALPCLVDRINEIDLQRIGDELVHLHSGIIDGGRVADPTHLLLGAELGWELANLTRDDEISRLFVASSTRALQDWCQHGSEALPNSIHLATNARLVLASLVRCKKLLLVGELSVEDRQKWKQIGRQLSLWVATLVCHNGSNAFAHLERQATVDDHCSDGLLAQAVKFDRDSLEGAVSAALGNAPKNPGLTWEVSLPEAMLHDTDGKLAILLPQWNVRSGRTHVDYSAAEVDLELFSGKKPLISGRLRVDLQIDGKSQEPVGQWEEVCEYTDDDVHYLEIEQEWTGNAMLQRQFLLIREDRSFVFADAVIPKDDSASLGRIDYSCRLPLMESVVDEPEAETREIFLSTGNRRTICLPLAASEWKMGQTHFDLSVSPDHTLVSSGTGQGGLYAPIWFDFQKRRFTRKRTWRQLTVADQLRIVEPSEANGYRVQFGSEQWMIYRSLKDQKTRTVLGKHLIADFYCSRFDSGDGSHEELITVDDSDTENEAE